MISVTTLSSYLYCPRKIYLTNVLRLVPPPKEIMVKGTIRHKVHEEINLNEESIVSQILDKYDKEKINQLYSINFAKHLRYAIIKNKEQLRKVSLPLDQAYKQIWPLLEKESLVRSNNIFDFKLKTKLSGKALWESLVPKIKSEIRVESEQLELKGIVDQIHVYPNKILPFELKTGKAPNDGAWPGHKIQIAAYMMLLSEKFNTIIEVGTIHYLDAEKKHDIFYNPFLKEEVLELRDKVKALLKSSEIPQICENTNKCNACSLKSKCYSL